jgi:hypothetical protein
MPNFEEQIMRGLGILPPERPGENQNRAEQQESIVPENNNLPGIENLVVSGRTQRGPDSVEQMAKSGAVIKGAEQEKTPDISPEAKPFFEMARTSPIEVFFNVDKFASLPESRRIIEAAATADPYLAGFLMRDFATDGRLGSSYFPETKGIIADAINNGESISAKNISEMVGESVKNPLLWSRCEKVLMINGFLEKENIPWQDAFPLVENENSFIKKLLEIKKHPEINGQMSIERGLDQVSYDILGKIDRGRELSDTERFKCLQGMDKESLFTILSHEGSRSNMYTSTFNGVFDRMQKDFKGPGMEEIVDNYDQKRINNFLTATNSFGRLDDFFGTISDKKRDELLTNFVKGIEAPPINVRMNESELDLVDVDKFNDIRKRAMTVADFSLFLSNPDSLKTVQKSIKQEYELEADSGGLRKRIFGSLAAIHAENPVAENEWLKEMAGRFEGGNFKRGILDKKDVFDESGLNRQRHFFYGDSDGKRSFESFLNVYKGKKDWNIENRDGYTLITSPVNVGRRIEIYANNPSIRGGGDLLTKYFKDNGIEPQMAVHRGHSIHIDNTLGNISSKNKLVFLGSCNSYENALKADSAAGEAHIFSTKNVGTANVNNKLLEMLNGEFLSGSENIDWRQFKEKATRELKDASAFGRYVFPHENAGIAFLSRLMKGEK